MKFINKLFLIIIIVLSCASCDQATKSIATNLLAGKAAVSFAGDTFRLQYSENIGAFLGLGENLPNEHRFILLVVFVSLLLMAVFLYTLFSKKLDLVDIMALSLVIGGGTGNLYDRILNNGAVVDFMNMGIGTVRTGIFNVADIFILLGLFILVLNMRWKTQQSLK